MAFQIQLLLVTEKSATAGQMWTLWMRPCLTRCRNAGACAGMLLEMILVVPLLLLTAPGHAGLGRWPAVGHQWLAAAPTLRLGVSTL